VNERIKTEDVIKYFIRIDRLHHNLLEKQVNKSGMHRGQHGILLYLHKQGGAFTQKEIADYFDISTAAVTNMLKKLEAAEYVAKVNDKNDLRRNKIIITEKGEELLGRTKQLVDKIDGKMFEDFSGEELETFSKCLDKIFANLEKIKGDDIT